MAMQKIQIDLSVCSGCGLCVKDCVGMDIELKDGKPVASGDACIRCGHCEAVCPKNAVKVLGYDDEVQEFKKPVTLKPDVLLDAIKTRRTIRQYTNEPVSKEVIDLIIEAGRLAPTGTNSQGTSYVVIQDSMAECEKIAVKMFSRLLDFGKIFIPMLKKMDITENYFFKKAPVAILILGKDKVSASLAAQNMAFMAEANGLGVLFSGFFTMCASMNGKIKKILGIKGLKPVTTLVIGHPAVKYKRTVHRNPANVKFC